MWGKEMLIREKVIFFDENHCEYENKKRKHKPSYIVPGYLQLFEQDKYCSMLVFDFSKPNFTLKFNYFIPFGLINQLICFYGSLPEEKHYWRDQLIFTFNGEYKVWIKLDFSQLTIAVYINPQQGESQKLKLKEVEKVIFLNIMDLYWDNEIRYKGKDDPELEKYIRRYDTSKQKDISNTEKKEQELFAAQVLVYIDEKMNNRADAKIDSPEDMYLSVDGKYFVHYMYLETLKEHQDSITVYHVRETEHEITDATNRGTEKKRKIEVIDTSSPKTLPVYPFKNFSNNKNIKGMKKIFISYSRKDVEYKDELKNSSFPPC